MRYPDGKIITVGDLVWWNEGVCVGFVEGIMESYKDYSDYGCSSPCLSFTNLHPFSANAQKHKQHVGEVSGGGSVIYPESILKDEGVALLTGHEQSELMWAISHSRTLVDESIKDLPFCITARKDMQRMEEDWNFQYVDQTCNLLSNKPNNLSR